MGLLHFELSEIIGHRDVSPPAAALKPPSPAWLHEGAPSGARTLKHYLQQTITKLVLCTYHDPTMSTSSTSRLFAVLENPNEMIKIGWQVSDYPIPRITFSYCLKSDFDAMDFSSQEELVALGPPVTQATFTLRRLIHLIMKHDLNTCLVTATTVNSKYQEYFSAWISIILAVLHQYDHIVWLATPKESMNLDPLTFLSPKANELQDILCSEHASEAKRSELKRIAVPS